MNLSVTLKGQHQDLTLKNPVIAASGTFGSGLEYAPFGDLSTLGGISVKGISLKPRPGNPGRRICETPSGMLNAIGLQNDGIDYFLSRVLPALPWRETAIIANIYGSEISDFAALAERLAGEEGIAALEINVSCPNVKAGGAIFGASPEMCAKVVAEVRKFAPAKHIICKLSPNVTDIAAIAKSAEKAGADSVSCINTLLGMAIDAKTARPILGNITGGLSGPAIRPIALRCVWQVYNAVKIPVIGLGGITSAENILEFLLAGASAIQVGTANFSKPDICFSLPEELAAELEKMSLSSPTQLTGALLTD